MQNRTNSTPFIEAEQYSNFILSNLHDGMLPESFFRNVSDFPNGSTLNIKVVGSATIRDQEEDSPIQYDPIDVKLKHYMPNVVLSLLVLSKNTSRVVSYKHVMMHRLLIMVTLLTLSSIVLLVMVLHVSLSWLILLI